MTNRVPVKEIGTHTIEVGIHLPSIHVFDRVVLRGMFHGHVGAWTAECSSPCIIRCYIILIYSELADLLYIELSRVHFTFLFLHRGIFQSSHCTRAIGYTTC